MKRRLLPFALLAALAAPPAALTSVTVTTNARRPSLLIDPRGYAEVGWTAGGVRRTLLILPRGQACFPCIGKPGWSWFDSVQTRSGGKFGATVPTRARARRYRATIVGPNAGTTLAPDASAAVATPIS